jgi:hypothetical protein
LSRLAAFAEPRSQVRFKRSGGHRPEETTRYERYYRPSSRSPPNRLVKASASSGLAKPNTTKSLSSRRREYVSGDADRTPAAQGITSLFVRNFVMPATRWHD